jgi:tetratricopeptide (TPR) repeat protein
VVALKVMLGAAFASADARRRFDREIELAARLQHENIVRVLEGGETAGLRYYAMEYVAGTRLDRYVETSPSDVSTIVNLFVQVCDAVEYAHSHGVIHRDLKPANVVIDEEGTPRILDFGLAKATSGVDAEETVTAGVSVPGQVVGTLHYLSPEQAAGATEDVDTRTDVYALGVMLFEALTGSLPFDTTGSATEVLRRIQDTPPLSPRSLSDRVDDDLETIILKALEKEQHRRYSSAREFADDLGRYLNGEPILARRPSSFYYLRKKLRKHRLAVALCTAVSVAVMIAVPVSSWLAHRELTRARWTVWWLQYRLECNPGPDALSRAAELYALYPELPEAALVRAQAQYRCGQRNEVTRFLESMSQIHAARWEFRAMLAEMYRETGDLGRAARLAAQAERDAPDTAAGWYMRSLATFDRQRALWCAEQAVQREPTHALAWARLTTLRLVLGDLDGALRGADRVLALGAPSGPDTPLCLGFCPMSWHHLRGMILFRRGRFQEAIEEFTRLNTYISLAHAYRRIGEYEKAVAAYTRQIHGAGEATPRVWVFYQRATPLWILGRADEALADYRRVRVLLGKPFYSDARAYLILRELDRQEEAEQVLAAALREVENPSWLRQIFRCLAVDITPDELVADGKARNNLEQLCEAYYYAGEVCLLSGQRAEACQWFEQCVQTGLTFDPDTELGTPMNEYELAQWRLDTVCAESPAEPTSQPS